jgi:NTE family protein
MKNLRLILLALYVALLAACSTPQTPHKPEPPAAAQPVWGLALGGGAARGFAHIGVLQVLEEAGLKPDVITGTSAGSLVAALYASGKSAADLQSVALSLDELSITDWTLPIGNRGMIRGEALAKYVRAQVAGKLIEQMSIPLGIVATKLGNGEEVVFRRGDTATAVRASSAVPAVFLPVKIGEDDYVDGGLVSPVPVAATRRMGAHVVVAVDISSSPEGNPTGNPVEILLQTTTIMGKSINRYALREADVVVRPVLAGMKSTDFSARLRSIEAGRAAMKAALPQLQQLLSKRP